MSSLLDRLRRLRCCFAPARVSGVVALGGAGSGEVFVAWDPLPASARIAHYRVYRRVQAGVWRPLAAVTAASTDLNFPGKVVLLDMPDNFPGFSDFGTTGARTYVVSAIGASGLEGPVSAEVVGSPP